MSLITPDGGLLFWMLVIFGIVFVILARFGFPVIIGMVDKRSAYIDKALEDARAAEVKYQQLSKEHDRMLQETRKEQTRILNEAMSARQQILEQAKSQAREESDKIIAQAKVAIAAEKESALRDIRSEVAALSVKVAEKVLRSELDGADRQQKYIDGILDEVMSSSAALHGKQN